MPLDTLLYTLYVINVISLLVIVYYLVNLMNQFSRLLTAFTCQQDVMIKQQKLFSHVWLVLQCILFYFQTKFTSSRFIIILNLHCKLSLLIDRYCDCFANGEFCNNCNCVNCSNNMEREKERSKAIKVSGKYLFNI